MSVLKTVTSNGDTATWPLVVKHNNTTTTCFNTKVAFTIPSGVSITGPKNQGSSAIVVPKGYYDLVTNTWHIGKLEPNEEIEYAFEFTVDDINLKGDDGRFIVTAVLSSSCVETNSNNNTDYLAIEVIDECGQISISIGVEESVVSSSDLTIG